VVAIASAPRSRQVYDGCPIHCIRAPADVHTVHPKPANERKAAAAATANDLGFTEVTIAALVGHTKGSVTSKYIHTLDTALIMAADTISGYIQGSLTALSSNRLPTRWTAIQEKPPWLDS
jgi:hypothetical protein